MKKLTNTVLLLFLGVAGFAQVTGSSLVCEGVYNVYQSDLSGFDKITWSIEIGTGDIQESNLSNSTTVHAMFTSNGKIVAKGWYKKEMEGGYDFIYQELSVNIKQIGTIQPPSVQACPFTLTRSGTFGVSSFTWEKKPYSGSTWSTLSTTSSSSLLTDISEKTDFRITSSECALTSNVITVDVMPKPQISVSNQEIFSGGSVSFPSATLSGTTISISQISTNVTGAHNAVGSSGSIATQNLSAPSGGTVTYTLIPSKNGCIGDSKNFLVTVNRTPQVSSSGNRVYKGKTVTLGTDTYPGATYQWIKEGTGNVSSSSTYSAGQRGIYKVTITKNGQSGTSAGFAIYGQLDGLNENYILVRQPQKEFTVADNFEDKKEDEISENIQYFDGLGRLTQSISVRNSPNEHHDVVQPVKYDLFGRESRKYLPYVSNHDNGILIKTDSIFGQQSDFYLQNDSRIASDVSPFSETVFDNSPLNRVVEQGFPGNAWQPGTNHTIKKQYLFNGATDVMLFVYDPDNGISTVFTYYDSNTLLCNKTIDEEQNDVLEYTDKEGRTVCKKVKSSGGVYASTYYIYDDFGNLVVVLPPEAIQKILTGN